MARLALEIADIFRAHGPAWRSANVGHLSLGQLKVMSAIEHCRTAARERPINFLEGGSPARRPLIRQHILGVRRGSIRKAGLPN